MDPVSAGAYRLNELLSVLDVGIWYCDLPFDKLNWDAKAREHFGMDPDAEVTIDAFYERIHPDDRERTRLAIERCIAEHTDYDVAYRTIRPSGDTRWIRVIGRAFYDSAGTPRRFDGISVDITKHKNTESELQESRHELEVMLRRMQRGQEQLRSALEASGTGTFRWDIQTNAMEWDENLDTLFGLAPGEAARTLDEFLARVHPADRPDVLSQCARCATQGGDFDMEVRVLWPDGSVRWLYDRGRTFLDRSGKPEYMSGGLCRYHRSKAAGGESPAAGAYRRAWRGHRCRTDTKQ